MDATRIALAAALTLLVAVVIALVIRWMRRRPTAAIDGGVRLPVVFAVLAWVIVAAGAMMALVAFTLDDADDPLPMRIASVAMVVGGVGLVLMHRNWRLAVLDDRVFQRTALGRVRCVVYDDIASSSLTRAYGAPLLQVRSRDGSRIAVNPAAFDVRPLLQAIAAGEYHAHTGERWG